MATTSFTFNSPTTYPSIEAQKKPPVKKTNELSRAELETKVKGLQNDVAYLNEQYVAQRDENQRLRQKLLQLSANPSLEDIQQNLTGLFFQMKIKEKVKITDKASVQRYFDILWDAIKRDSDEPLAE